MKDSYLLILWTQLHLLGKSFVIGLSLGLCACRGKLFSFPENIEKYFRSFALGAQLALLFWPLFPSCIFRGRVDLSLSFVLPFLWGLGNLSHFLFYSFSKKRLPIKDFSGAALVGLFVIPWAPVTSSYWQSTQVLWCVWALVLVLSSEATVLQGLIGLSFISFFFSLFGFFFPDFASLLLTFVLGIWTYGLFREVLVLFSFFPEGNKRYFPALVAFVFTLAVSLAWA